MREAIGDGCGDAGGVGGVIEVLGIAFEESHRCEFSLLDV